MQKIVLITFLLFSSYSFSQKLDTLNYLKSFELNKSEYIDKPFSVLLADMKKIQPKTVWQQHGRYRTSIIGNRFNFCDMEYSFDNVITLSVKWSESIPTDDFKYYTNRNGFYFTDEERSFLGNKIIKDIMVYR